MEIYGKFGGISEVQFDWLEEENACLDCRPNAYDDDGYLTWTCEVCGGGSAEWFPLATPSTPGANPGRSGEGK